MTIWDMIKPEFSKAENWGSHKHICGLLLLSLTIIRRETGWPIVIHNAYEVSGHAKASMHYVGKAADFHFATSVPFKEQAETIIDILERYQISNSLGLGAYPFWNNKGFHLDTRGEHARWSQAKDGKYVSFEEGIV